jgi:dephospho-CoA kinase
VVNEFGHDLVAADGTINRQLLGGKVFGDPAQMKRLTDIVWPEIRKLAAEEIADLRKRDDKSIIVLEAAVMIEANWMDLVDEVWIVTVPPEVARDRLVSRNNLTAEQAQARIDSQLTNKERLQYADVKIENSGTQEQFEQKVEREWKRLLKRSAEASSDGTKSAGASKRQAGRK